METARFSSVAQTKGESRYFRPSTESNYSQYLADRAKREEWRKWALKGGKLPK